MRIVIDWLGWLLMEVFLSTVCGWVGYHFVRMVTLGKAELDWGNDSGSLLAEWIGFAVVAFVAGGIAFLLRTWILW